jgi:hypothetical protein
LETERRRCACGLKQKVGEEAAALLMGTSGGSGVRARGWGRGVQLGQSRRRLGLKGDRLEVEDDLRVPHDNETAAAEGAGGPSWAGCWATAGDTRATRKSLRASRRLRMTGRAETERKRILFYSF